MNSLIPVVAFQSTADRRRQWRGLAGIWAGLAWVLLAANPALAGQDKDVDYTKMDLEQLLSVPVYAASKHEQNSAEAPSSVTVITAPEIRAYGWRTLGDVLASAPGFYVTYPRTYGFVGVRGFGRPGDFGGRILLLLNGHRMNDPLYDTAAVVNDFLLDLDLIDRVEVVRGPGSALYGNNAFFAVINVVTKRPGHLDGFQASGEAGTFAAYRGRLSYGLQGKNGTDLLISASRYTSQGNPSLYFPEYDDPKTDYGVIHDADGESAHSLYAALHRGPLNLEAAYVGRNKEEPAPGYGTVFGIPRRTFDRRGMLEGRLDIPLSDHLQAQTRLYYDWYEYRGDYPYSQSETDPTQEIIINRDESLSTSIGSEMQLNWHASPRLAGVAGAEYRHDLRDAMKNFDLSPYADYLDINPRIRCGALYLQEEYRPQPNFVLTAGVRYDHYNTFGGTVNPRVACVYNPARLTTLKLLYGQAFRAPNVNEFFYEDDGLSAKINPNLRPERIKTYEMVCEQRIGRAYRVSLAGFYNHVFDLIDQMQDPVDGLYYDANLGRVEARGVEFQLDYQLVANARARASYTYTRTKDETTGLPLSNSPRHLGKVNLTGFSLHDWLVFGGEVQYTGGRTTIDGTTLDPVILCNATLGTAEWRDRYDLSLGIYNVFDARYRDPDASITSVERDGRTARLKLAARF